MTEEKKTSMVDILKAAQEAKNKKNGVLEKQSKEQKGPKVNSKGFGAPTVVRRTGRGG
jgi:hypothetical protein